MRVGLKNVKWDAGKRTWCYCKTASIEDKTHISENHLVVASRQQSVMGIIPTMVVVDFFSPPPKKKMIWQGKACSCMDSLYLFVHKSRPPLSAFAHGLNIHICLMWCDFSDAVSSPCHLALCEIVAVTWTNSCSLDTLLHSSLFVSGEFSGRFFAGKRGCFDGANYRSPVYIWM